MACGGAEVQSAGTSRRIAAHHLTTTLLHAAPYHLIRIVNKISCEGVGKNKAPVLYSFLAFLPYLHSLRVDFFLPEAVVIFDQQTRYILSFLVTSCKVKEAKCEMRRE